MGILKKIGIGFAALFLFSIAINAFKAASMSPDEKQAAAKTLAAAEQHERAIEKQQAAQNRIDRINSSIYAKMAKYTMIDANSDPSSKAAIAYKMVGVSRKTISEGDAVTALTIIGTKIQSYRCDSNLNELTQTLFAESDSCQVQRDLKLLIAE